MAIYKYVRVIDGAELVCASFAKRGDYITLVDPSATWRTELGQFIAEVDRVTVEYIETFVSEAEVYTKTGERLCASQWCIVPKHLTSKIQESNKRTLELRFQK